MMNSSSRFCYLAALLVVVLLFSTNAAVSFAAEKIVTDDGPVPASIDWRSRGAVTSVKNAGPNCTGGSWAFATAGAVEGVYQIATGQLLDLSPQHLLDCQTTNTNAGCKSGFPQFAFEYLGDEATGLHTEADYPFTGTSGTCQKKDGFIVSIDGYDNFYSSTPSDDSDIVKSVAKQPVTAVVDGSSDAFKNYKSGIFKGPCSNTTVSLSVLIVGYGTENGEDYWIIKNSWGTSWGENGYMRLQRGKHGLPLGRCAINSFVWYPTKAPSTPAQGVVGWWKLDEKTGGVAKDSSSSQAAGTINGATWSSSSSGLTFNGNGRVLCGSGASLCGKTPFSLVAWIKVATTTNTKGVIIQQRGPGNWTGKGTTTDGYNGEYQLYVENNGKPSLWVFGDNDHQFRFSASVAVNDNKWHHIVAVRDGREGRIYVDGNLSGSATGDVKNLVSNIPVFLGCDCRDNVDFFKGSLSGLRIYSRAISVGEIKQLSLSSAPSGVAASVLHANS